MNKWTGLLTLLVMIASSSAFAIKEVGNGGDPLALEFKLSLYRAIEDLKTQNLHVNMQNLTETAHRVHVLVVEDSLTVPYADGTQNSAAENYGAQNLIKVNRAAWNAITNPAIKQALALHEVLSIMGVEGTADYSISQVYLNQKSGLRLNSVSLSSAKVSTPCPAPKADAALLFKLLADPQTSRADLQKFAAAHAVAADALNQQCQTPLMYSLITRREDLFRVLYEAQPTVDVNAVQSRALARADQRSMFFYIVAVGSYPLIEEFRAKGGKLEPLLNDVFEDGVTEFMIAASTNSVDVIKNYLSRGASVNEETRKSRFTPIMLTASNNTPEAVRTMIAAGADIRRADIDGVTALMRAAAKSESPETLKLLVEAGADVNGADKSGMTVIHYALDNSPSTREMIKALIALGANADITPAGRASPLMQAAYFNYEISVRALLEAGVRVNATNQDFLTALAYAAASPQDTSQVIRELISAGANADAVDRHGETAIFQTTTRNLEVQLPKLRALIEGGANVNQKNESGLTPLMYAAEFASLETFSYLINEAGADRNIISPNNDSAWSFAKNSGRSKEILDLLYTDAVKNTGFSNAPSSPQRKVPSPSSRKRQPASARGSRAPASPRRGRSIGRSSGHSSGYSSGRVREDRSSSSYELPPCSQTLCI